MVTTEIGTRFAPGPMKLDVKYRKLTGENRLFVTRVTVWGVRGGAVEWSTAPAPVAQGIEHRSPKAGVTGSNPVGSANLVSVAFVASGATRVTSVD